jgi:hypothetical protein
MRAARRGGLLASESRPSTPRETAAHSGAVRSRRRRVATREM